MAEFQQGLMIAAIGMGLVFVVIILLWGLMALLMRVTSKETQIENQAGEDPLSEDPMVAAAELNEEQRRAAAAAVAVGIAMAGRQSKTTGIKMSALSPWQTVHRLRQLEKRKR